MVNPLRDDVAAALHLQQDSGSVGEAVPVRQAGQAARSHLPVQFRLHDSHSVVFFFFRNRERDGERQRAGCFRK
jgi:hypothetical protein